MDLITRLFGSRRVLVPIVVGVVALLAGGFLAYLTIRDSGGDAAETASASEVRTRSFVSRRGGFAIDVPVDLDVARRGGAATFAAEDKSLVVTAGPGGPGRLKPASTRFLNTLSQGYQDFRLLGRDPERIDGRPALVSFGQATNEADVRIRFVAVLVRGGSTNYTITAFTALDSDPKVVLPRVNAIVNSFQVLPRKG